MESKKIIAKDLRGRLGIYLEGDNIHLEYDGYFDPDDPEDQLFIRGEAPLDEYRRAISKLQKDGYCTLSLTSGNLELKVISEGLWLYHKPGLGMGITSTVDWTIKQLII